MIDWRGRIEAALSGQHRCPHGLIGRIVGERMARQHAPETRWTIGLLELAPADHVLEVGCGAGRATELVAAQAPDGYVAGVDLSPTMVRAAGRRNARAIGAGRVTVQQSDVTRLPFADRHFDKILSIHALYFWPDPARAMAELGRVLKPSGVLALTLSPGKVGAEEDTGYRTMVEERVIPAIKHSGFTSVRVERGPDSRQFRTVAIVGAK